MRRLLLDKNESFTYEPNELLVLSNYFTSKKDPQRNVFQQLNDFSYIKSWYESIVKNKLNAIIFHDGLNMDFVNKYQTSKIRFVKCEIGDMSLNDERFFIFYEFLKKMDKNNYVLVTDINDVIIRKSPLEFFLKSPDRLFLGRDEKVNWRSGTWNLNKLKEFELKTKTKFPSSYIYYPVFNAGLIGGKVTTVNKLFGMMTENFSTLNDEGNYNMVNLNWILFNYYYKPSNKFLINLFSYDFMWKVNISMHCGKLSFLKSIFRENISNSTQGIINSQMIYSGFPFNSLFKKFEDPQTSKAYLIHK
ncbi:hypothetical protein [Echinicola salinicaeni]|uniref:hypothetical protein n=1 Tax=Echinicola salinicaeni TaxID=2762757 RepID=UPI001645C57E|nr:hypothetical protein [Echinicola salinicaeni]